MKRELMVGLVFTTLLGALVAATIFVEKPGFFRPKLPFTLNSTFHDVAGLKEGDEVWVYGTRAGRVEHIHPNGRGGVDVGVSLEYDPQMREDAVVRIAQRSALGGAIVSIHPGTPAKPLSTRASFDGVSAAGPFQEVAEAIQELKPTIKASMDEMKSVLGDFSKRSESIARNLDETLQNTNTITANLRAGEGTIGALLKDKSVYEDLKAAVADLRKVAGDASSGGGTIDLLLHDKSVAADLRAAAANVRALTDDVNSGKGTIGRLFKDEDLYRKLDAAVTDLGALAQDARTGKGALGKLIYDEQFAKRLDTISDDIAAVTGKVRRGEGTLGKLINDESVYRDLKDALKRLGGGAEDVRENAPVLTFAGFLFSGF